MHDKLERITKAMMDAFIRRDILSLRKITDECIEHIAISFSREFYLLAQVSYVLSKLVTKPRYWKKENARKVAEIENRLTECVLHAERRELSKLDSSLNGLLVSFSELDERDKRFIERLVEKAQVKIAATIYAEGVSLGSSSAMTGVDKQEILHYAGKTMIFDRIKTEMGILERLKKTRKLFK
jgi:hypothetical protein